MYMDPSNERPTLVHVMDWCRGQQAITFKECIRADISEIPSGDAAEENLLVMH